jgi:homoserine kinase type II
MVLDEGEVCEILLGYDIGKYLRHKMLDDVFENDVYVLETSKGKYILKVLKKPDMKQMRGQLDVIDFLYSKKIPVVKNVVDKKGKELVKFNGEWMLIQGFVEGTCEDDFDRGLIKNIAGHVGKMHKILLKSRFAKGKDNKHLYKRRNPAAIKKYSLGEIYDKIFEELDMLDSSKLRRARIHSDLTNVNLLIKDNKLNAIIDWDDSDYDYLAYEIAIFLAHSCVRGKKIYWDKIKIFFKEYQKYVKLNGEEKRAIYFLMKYRLFGIFHWYVHYMKSRPERREMLEKGIARSVRRIFNFEKVGVEEFVEGLG